jgi:hypothetical protein
MTDDVKRKMKEYGITSVRTAIIDGSIKVVGILDFPWICSNDLYKKLKRQYPLKKDNFSDSLPT